jgi:hypothetical protein
MAPEAAINGAYAYKQTGDYAAAIAMYELFVRTYGAEAKLAALKKADPRRYQERLKYVEQASRTLAEGYVIFFDYRRAADNYAALARLAGAREQTRREVAQNAAILYATLGDARALAAAQATFRGLSPSAEEKASMEYATSVRLALAAWDEGRPDEGANRAARVAALAALERFRAGHKAGAPVRLLVDSAHEIARLRRAGHDAKATEACKETIAAMDFAAREPSRGLDSSAADMATECAVQLVDEKIKVGLPRRYQGDAAQVEAAFKADLPRAEAYFNELQGALDRYRSRSFGALVVIRQAVLYEGFRTALEATKLPEATRERLLVETDRAAVRAYVQAILHARAHGTPVADARRRLASYAARLGDVRMAAYTAHILDPDTHQGFVYEDGMFLKARPGMSIERAPEVILTPPLAP